MRSPKTAVFTTVRAKNGHLFHLDLHMERLAKHAEILGLEVPDIDIPENLEGLVRIEINSTGYIINVKKFYQEPHMDAEGITFPAPRWTRKVNGTKHGNWEPYQKITSEVFEKGADVGLLVHDYCIIDGDRVTPLVLDNDGVVWISDSSLGGVDSVTFQACKPIIENAGFVISEGRLNEKLVAHAKEIVLLGSGMGAARLTVLDDVDIGDGSNSLQKICIAALGEDWP
tara:strand:- start:213 stop:896 length:684 start_codon:yes stop_codon:yes gene_type:complete